MHQTMQPKQDETRFQLPYWNPPSVQSSKRTRTGMSSTTRWRLYQDKPTVRGLIKSNAVVTRIQVGIKQMASTDRSIAGWVHYTHSHSVRIQTLRQSFRNHQCIGAEDFSTDPPRFAQSLARKKQLIGWSGESCRLTNQTDCRLDLFAVIESKWEIDSNCFDSAPCFDLFHHPLYM